MIHDKIKNCQNFLEKKKRKEKKRRKKGKNKIKKKRKRRKRKERLSDLFPLFTSILDCVNK